MNIFEIYDSLPPSTLAETARRMGLHSGSVRLRLRNMPFDREAWAMVAAVLADWGERANGAAATVAELLAEPSGEPRNDS